MHLFHMLSPVGSRGHEEIVAIGFLLGLPVPVGEHEEIVAIGLLLGLPVPVVPGAQRAEKCARAFIGLVGFMPVMLLAVLGLSRVVVKARAC